VQLILILLAFFTGLAPAATPGLARFDLYSAALAGKRVGLVVNQASVAPDGSHAIEFLRSRGVRVVRLYGLEHGVRGAGGAGEHIADGVDAPSGLPVVSLYGARRKPSPADLAGVDVVVFDIQDVGVRFFTYISSLGLILEAAAEQGKPVVVLDRPNPNGDYVDGPVSRVHSFVSAFPIPVVYGLTIGELARMIVGERWQHTAGISLKVIPLAGYDRAKPEPLPVPPSPGLRTFAALRAYPWIGLFEPTDVSVGRGTEHPYEVFGRPGDQGDFSFTPGAAPVGDPPLYLGLECRGRQFFTGEVPRFTTDFFTAERPGVKDRAFLNLLVGDAAVVSQMLAGKPYTEIRRGLEGPLREFSARKRKYELY
jgi:uncharacterized protein YbbC (DUF1343 family)